MNKFLASLGIVGVLALVALLLVVGPFLSILAVNQLFGTTIALTFWNWVCVAWLHMVVASVGSRNKN